MNDGKTTQSACRNIYRSHWNILNQCKRGIWTKRKYIRNNFVYKVTVTVLLVAATFAVTTAVVSGVTVVGRPVNVYVAVLPGVPLKVRPVPEIPVILIVTLHPDPELAVNVSGEL